jgi:hypothetical protein
VNGRESAGHCEEARAAAVREERDDRLMPPKRKPPPKRPPGEKRKPPPPPEEPPCIITIISTPAERSFSPPTSISGRETFRAVLAGARPPGSRIQWDLVPGAGTGTIEFESPGSLTTVVRARHPNNARVRVRVLRRGVVLCEDVKDISVPQFFRIVFTAEFDRDLARLGLRRRGRLNAGQIGTNVLVRAAVVGEIFVILRTIYAAVNVRFLTLDPTPFVGAGNFANVTIGGPDDRPRPGRTRLGRTPNPRAGPNARRLDVGNLDPTNSPLVFSAEFGDRRFPQTGGSATYRAIFDGLAVEDEGTGAALPGSAVNVGDFANPAIAGALTLGQLKVQAAIRAFGRLVGETSAHECGHSLGLVPPRGHNAGNTGELMDEGRFRTFAERTGITAFNPATGALTIGATNMLVANLPTLQAILPVPPVLR